MGKVVKAVAIIALAVAVAVLAPQLGGVFLSLVGSSTAVASAMAVAATTALAGRLIGMAGGFAIMAFSKSPTTAAPGLAATKSLPSEFVAGALIQDDYPAAIARPLPAVDPSGWQRLYHLHSQRFAVVRTSGDCMMPAMSKNAYIVVDRISDINPGDFFVFRTNDLRGWMNGMSWWQRWKHDSLAKRYDGREVSSRKIYFHCTHPRFQRAQTGQDRLIYAYRVASHHRAWLAAARAAYRLSKAVT